MYPINPTMTGVVMFVGLVNIVFYKPHNDWGVYACRFSYHAFSNPTYNDWGVYVCRFNHHVFSYNAPTLMFVSFDRHLYCVAVDSEWR